MREDQPEQPGSIPRWRRWLLLGCLLVGVGSLASLLAVQRAHDTVFDPEFYPRHFAREGVFDQLSEDFVPTEVREQLQARFDRIEPTALDDASEIARRSLPPSWFEMAALQISEAVVPWLLNEESGFEVRIDVRDRVRHAGALVRARLPHSAVVHELYRQAVTQIVDHVTREQPALPFDITVSKRTWYRALTTAAPFPWVASNLSRKVGHLVAYLIGERDDLRVVIPLYEQQAETALAVRFIVEDTDTLSFIQSRVLEPAIRENVEDKELLPSVGIVLDKEVIGDAFIDVLTSSWVRNRKEDMVTVFSNYIAGRTNELELRVPLKPVKVLAAQRLTSRVDDKFRAYFELLPPCTRPDLARKLIGLDTDVLCRPPGYTYEEAKSLMGIDIERLVLKKLDERIPDLLVHDENAIRAYVHDSTWYGLQRVRSYMQHGYEITEQELRKFVGDDREDVLSRALKITRNGIVINDAKVLQSIESRSGPEVLSRIDSLRTLFAFVAASRPVLAGLLAIALLGLLLLTRDRPSRRWGFMGAMALGAATTLLLLHGALGTAIRLEFVSFGQDLWSGLSNTVASRLSQAAPRILRSMARDYLVGLTRMAVAVGFFGLCLLTAAMTPTPSRDT